MVNGKPFFKIVYAAVGSLEQRRPKKPKNVVARQPECLTWRVASRPARRLHRKVYPGEAQIVLFLKFLISRKKRKE